MALQHSPAACSGLASSSTCRKRVYDEAATQQYCTDKLGVLHSGCAACAFHALIGCTAHAGPTDFFYIHCSKPTPAQPVLRAHHLFMWCASICTTPLSVVQVGAAQEGNG